MDQNSEEYKTLDLKHGVEYIGVNCVFYCHDGRGKVLMAKRSAKARDEQGTWDSGAGSMEFGETFEDTVRREVMEEYGVEPLEITYVDTMNVLRTHDGKPTHWVKNIHWVLVDPAKVHIADTEKLDEIGWFDLDNPPRPLHSQWEVETKILKRFLNKNR